MNLELLKRAAAVAAVLATSAPSHALAADANQACSRLLPKGTGLPAAPAEAIAVPVRASALVTSAQFAVAELRTGDGRSESGTRLLAFSGQGLTSKVFAEFRAVSDSHAVLAWHIPASDGAAEGALRRLAVFEHLYAFVLREPPLTVYDVHGPGGESVARKQSHPELLTRLARMRNCAAKDVEQAGGQVLLKAWEMPVLTKPVARGKARLDVSARVTYPAADGRSGSLTVARGSCMVCSTPVDRNGGAACTLFDSHGHADADDDVSATTVVTYSGVIERARIVLPMTRVDIGTMRPFTRVDIGGMRAFAQRPFAAPR